MSIELKFVLFQLVIIGPFLLGSILRKRFRNLSTSAKAIIAANLIVFEPPVILWSIWGLDLAAEMIVLPLAGLAMVVTGFLLAKPLLPYLSLDARKEKTFIISSSLANHGFTLGGFLCYIFAGERGLALSSIFLIYFVPYTFLFIFPYASKGKTAQKWSLRSVVASLLTLRNMPLLAVFVALLLKCFQIQRPSVAFPLDELLIVSISLYYFTLGINFTPADLNPLKRVHLFLALERFVLIPLLTIVILKLLHLGPDLNLVILLEAFMPAAIYSVVSAIIFDLESRLASSLFVVNSLVFILVVLPLLLLFNKTVGFEQLVL